MAGVPFRTVITRHDTPLKIKNKDVKETLEPRKSPRFFAENHPKVHSLGFGVPVATSIASVAKNIKATEKALKPFMTENRRLLRLQRNWQWKKPKRTILM